MGEIKKVRIIFLLCILIISACEERVVTENTNDSFGIYLTRDEVLPTHLEALSHIAPADKPLISLNEIVSYTWSDHTILLTEKGRQILDTLSLGVYGRSFLVCVNGSPKYHGAFWTLISSVTFVGTTIIITRWTSGIIRIGRGYPIDFDTSLPDPRMNSDVETVLRLAGKLR
ncbi:MAG: hypothetical protein RDU14_12805 [Melioribacteraceae bacterium]|nr:hypothetical protein [Melioribacteraceae bacterium]